MSLQPAGNIKCDLSQLPLRRYGVAVNTSRSSVWNRENVLVKPGTGNVLQGKSRSAHLYLSLSTRYTACNWCECARCSLAYFRPSQDLTCCCFQSVTGLHTVQCRLPVSLAQKVSLLVLSTRLQKAVMENVH